MSIWDEDWIYNVIPRWIDRLNSQAYKWIETNCTAAQSQAGGITNVSGV